jgi:hypothetical protein
MQLKTLLLPLLVSLIGCTTTSKEIQANPNEIEGVVVMVGSAPLSRPVVEPNGPKSQVEICAGAKLDEIRKFSGTFIKMVGQWKDDAVAKARCYAVESFKPTQLVKGRPAIIGQLEAHTNDAVILKAETGKEYVILTPSKGVKELVGKKVILDLQQNIDPTQKSEKNGGAGVNWKVVAYMAYP